MERRNKCIHPKKGKNLIVVLFLGKNNRKILETEK
jgi:hypothetical protein